MRIGGVYSFNRGKEVLESDYSAELQEIQTIIATVDAAKLKTKKSAEKTMPGRLLYSPKALNRTFSRAFRSGNWEKHREHCEYPADFYTGGYSPPGIPRGAFREIDFVKNEVGVEVQFGKYAFMVYNVAAKMSIFRNLGIIKVGVEIVPLKELADQMSTGVSYFEQFVWDLEHRGVSNIDIPVLILGIVP